MSKKKKRKGQRRRKILIFKEVDERITPVKGAQNGPSCHPRHRHFSLFKYTHSRQAFTPGNIFFRYVTFASRKNVKEHLMILPLGRVAHKKFKHPVRMSRTAPLNSRAGKMKFIHTFSTFLIVFEFSRLDYPFCEYTFGNPTHLPAHLNSKPLSSR